jgi:selenocysteine lyase/cysteine desulfurase
MKTTRNILKIVGMGQKVILPSGEQRRVIRLNNAATTPPFVYTLQKVGAYLQTYGALHRGAGPLAARTYEYAQKALTVIRRFFSVPPSHALLFTSNTSAAINMLVRLLPLTKGDVVLLSSTEHTSNHLPWLLRTVAKTVYISSFPDGSFDYADLEKKLQEHRGRVKWVSITGASNLTGYIPDIKRIARLVHSAKAKLFVDAAQLAPHRRIDMRTQGIDALAFSAHKLYAPFGLGVLIMEKSLLKRTPVDPGGGSIDMLGSPEIVWAPPAERHQTGTWNVTGIVALAASCEAITRVGWETIVSHERTLRDYLLQKLVKVKDLTLYVSPERYRADDRTGAITFNMKGFHHALLAAILEHEYGIETRAGTICNHRLVRRWIGINDAKQAEIERRIKSGNRLASYGIVRVSLGVHNTKQDVDSLIDALVSIQKDGPKLKYRPVPKEETFVPVKR